MNPSAPTATSSASSPSRRWSVAAALLIIHAALAIDTLRQKSVTVDEVGHLPAGISYWQKRTFELYHHNPPLVKLLAALPALAANPTVDYSKSWEANRARGLPLSPWSFGWEFMYANAARYHDIYFWSRLPVVGLSLLAGLFIFLWARELFGPLAGLVGLTLWTFCPNAIAHAGMVTTDMGATSIGFVATYFFWRYLRQPTILRASLSGVLLGLAELTKFSLLMLYLLWPLMWLGWFFLNRRSPTADRPIEVKSRKAAENRRCASEHDKNETSQPEGWMAGLSRGALHLLLTVAISVLVINWGYFFEGSFRRLGDFQFMSRSLTRPRHAGAPLPAVPREHPWFSVLMERQNRFAGTWLSHLPVPLPRHYVEGFDEQKLESEGVNGQGYPVYLRGELRRTGWWWYYCYALAVKVPLGTWWLSVAAMIVAVRSRSARVTLADELVLLAPVAVVLFVMSFLTNINLGLRYVLPIFPFWFVVLSRAACLLEPRRLMVAALMLAPLFWNVGRCVWFHPNHLAYFNELAGGPREGYRHLIDSNLDWGQDLLQLQAWLKTNRPGEKVGLAYFGNVDPSILAASGRPIAFTLAPPRQREDVRLVATQPGGPLYAKRNQWAGEHLGELQQWLTAEQAQGRRVTANDHPDLRELAFDYIALAEGPQPGLFAISANFVAGLPFRLRDQEGNIWNAEQDAYGYFRRLTPVVRVGNSIFVYDVTPTQADALRAELGVPEAVNLPRAQPNN